MNFELQFDHVCLCIYTQNCDTISSRSQTNPGYFFDDIAMQRLTSLGYKTFMSVMQLLSTILKQCFNLHRNSANHDKSMDKLKTQAKSMGVSIINRRHNNSNSKSSYDRKMRKIDQLFENLQSTCVANVNLKQKWIGRELHINPSTIMNHPKIADAFAKQHKQKLRVAIKKHKIDPSRITNAFFTMQKRNLSFRDMQEIRISVSDVICANVHSPTYWNFYIWISLINF